MHMLRPTDVVCTASRGEVHPAATSIPFLPSYVVAISPEEITLGSFANISETRPWVTCEKSSGT